jgi:UDP-2,4-diacetamido-2,4,6-trideoxy-beta-L-altropyranose hydrolase
MVDILLSDRTLTQLIIRADASTQMGSGHLMRCLALGQAWEHSGGKVQFVTTCTSKQLLRRLHEENFTVHHLDHPFPDAEDWQFTRKLLAQQPGALLVLDGYHFTSDYQKQVKNAGYRLMVIDDMNNLPHYYADIVLNQNILANNLRYSCEPHTTLLLGSKYALLRREFLKWRGWKRTVPTVARNVLVTLGGGDPDNVTMKVIQALQLVNLPGLQATVLAGSSNPHYRALERAVEVSDVSFRLERDTESMPELIAWADIAIAAAGTTSWELAFMGTPRLTVVLAENQKPIAEGLAQWGAAENLGWHESVSPAEITEALIVLMQATGIRAEMSRCSQDLVDGEGADRVLMHLNREAVRIRTARESDCRLLWEWANEPEARSLSFSSAAILWEDHRRWFTSKLADPNCFIFIGFDDQDGAIGYVRFDINDKCEAVVSINLDRSKRGFGHATQFLRMAIKELTRRTGIRAIHAFIKPDNSASVRTFEKAEFSWVGFENVRANPALHYILSEGSD